MPDKERGYLKRTRAQEERSKRALRRRELERKYGGKKGVRRRKKDIRNTKKLIKKVKAENDEVEKIIKDMVAHTRKTKVKPKLGKTGNKDMYEAYMKAKRERMKRNKGKSK